MASLIRSDQSLTSVTYVGVGKRGSLMRTMSYNKSHKCVNVLYTYVFCTCNVNAGLTLIGVFSCRTPQFRPPLCTVNFEKYASSTMEPSWRYIGVTRFSPFDILSVLYLWISNMWHLQRFWILKGIQNLCKGSFSTSYICEYLVCEYPHEK